MFGHDDHDENNKPEDEHKQDDQQSDDVVKPEDTPSDDGWQHPGPPPEDDESDDKPEEPSETPAPANFSISQTGSDSHKDSPDNDLIDLKQEVLGKLSPLVGHLDQDPAEKFRTLMMMIQASDDQSLVREAYQTALKIDDEKERAKALLDIVNEINYFTQNPGNDAS